MLRNHQPLGSSVDAGRNASKREGTNMQEDLNMHGLLLTEKTRASGIRGKGKRQDVSQSTPGTSKGRSRSLETVL